MAETNVHLTDEDFQEMKDFDEEALKQANKDLDEEEDAEVQSESESESEDEEPKPKTPLSLTQMKAPVNAA